MAKVCKSYVWANHGSWCSWYAWTCPMGPPCNVDSTDCSTSGSCGVMGSPGCIGRDAVAGPGGVGLFKTSVHFPDEFPGKHGYGKDKNGNTLPDPKDKRKKHQNDPDPPDDPIKVKVQKILKEHVKFKYRDKDGNVTSEKDALIFLARVHNADKPEEKKGNKALLVVGYEIDPHNNPDATYSEDEVQKVNDHCIAIDRGAFVVDILLHHDSPIVG